MKNSIVEYLLPLTDHIKFVAKQQCILVLKREVYRYYKQTVFGDNHSIKVAFDVFVISNLFR